MHYVRKTTKERWTTKRDEWRVSFFQEEKKDRFSQKNGRPPANRRERWVSRIVVALCFTTEIVAAAVALADYMPTLTEPWAESEKERQRQRKRELHCPTLRETTAASLSVSFFAILAPFWVGVSRQRIVLMVRPALVSLAFAIRMRACVHACTHKCFTVARLEGEMQNREGYYERDPWKCRY